MTTSDHERPLAAKQNNSLRETRKYRNCKKSRPPILRFELCETCISTRLPSLETIELSYFSTNVLKSLEFSFFVALTDSILLFVILELVFV